MSRRETPIGRVILLIVSTIIALPGVHACSSTSETTTRENNLASAAPTTTSAPTAAPTTTAAPTAAPTTTAVPPPSSPSSYTQDWLRGDTNVVADPSHVHEGLRLAAGDGWVGVGGTYRETYGDGQVIVRKINNEGTIQWTATFGDSDSSLAYSVGFGIAEGGSNLYVAAGLWQKSSNQMKPAILALDSATGNYLVNRKNKIRTSFFTRLFLISAKLLCIHI